ncbi:MAG: transcriptional regulator [Rhodosalinus sp.]
MPAPISSATERPRAGARLVWAGLAGIALLLAGVAVLLLAVLPDADAFNARVERIFVENDDLTGQAEIRLLEILAQSGSAFSETLAGYRVVILVLLVFSAAMLLAAIVFLVLLLALNRRMAQIERAGIQVNSLILSREENTVYLNNIALKLTDAAMETLAALAEARLDDEMLSGADLEAVITGRPAADCDEAAGATRIKRLRDGLGNQLVSELLVRNIARRGYLLAIDKDAIRML